MLVDKKRGWPPCAEAEARAVTDKNGRYTVEIAGLKKVGGDAPWVHFSVEVMAARCVPETKHPARRQSAFPLAGRRRRVNVELKAACALAGRVLDEKGNPIPGTTVYIYQSSSHGCFNPSLVGGEWPVTDVDGRFLADGMPLDLPSEQRQVAGFSHADFERRFVQRIASLPRDVQGVAHIEVTLGNGFGIAGTVVDVKGRPVSDCKVLVMAVRPYEGDPGCARPPARWDIRTDEQGRYAANGLPPMYYHVIATHDGLPPGATGPVSLMDGSRAGVEVALNEEVGVLSGSVTRADGTPAVGVELRAEQYLPRVQLSARTDERGRYLLSGFAPGLPAVFAGFSDLDSLAWFVPPNKSADIHLHAELAVKGRLTDGRTGCPIRRRKKVLLSRNPAWHRGFEGLSASLSGLFEVKGVWPGEYFLCAHARGYAPTCREVKIEPGSCDLGDVPLHRGVTLCGIVTSPDGAPIPNAEVFIDGPQFYDGKTVYSGRNGRYRFKGLSNGSYQFRARAEGWAPSYENAVVLPAKGGVLIKDVRLAKGVQVSGHVRHGDRPVTSQIVVLTGCGTGSREWATSWIADTNTDQNGWFLFSHVVPGEYTACCGLERRRIKAEGGGGLVCDFQWPGRIELPSPNANSDHGG